MIKLLLEEYLDEMATIYKSTEYGIMVAVNPDSNRNGNPYFKFYNSSNYRKATKVIRVLFKEPDYVIHSDNMDLWKITSKEVKLLIDILNKPSTRYKPHSNWVAAKFDWNYEYLEELLDINDYVKGLYDDKYKNNPGYVPSTLKMPDYTKLKF